MVMMAKKKEEEKVVESQVNTESPAVEKTVTPNDRGWTEYVLSLLDEDEKIKGNPTTDGLRRIFETALNVTVIASTTTVVQSPSPDNEKRATVVHNITFVPNDMLPPSTGSSNPTYGISKVVSGSADVYWGNCDKIYRNHPVAVAETRAEGRALRRGLKLHKVVAAEELSENIDDDVDQTSVNKISSNQINFIDVMAQRLNIDVKRLLAQEKLENENVYNLLHTDAVGVLRLLSKYQQDISLISPDILGYSSEWK